MVLYFELNSEQALLEYNDDPDNLAIKAFVETARETCHQIDNFD